MKAAQTTRTADRTASRTLELFKTLLGDYEPRNVAVRLWDGSEWPEDGEAEVTWVVNDPSFLRSALQAPTDLALGEAYIRGDFDVEGDVAAAFPLLDYLIGRDWRLLERLTLGLKLSRLPNKPTRGPHLSGRKHSPQRDQAAVQYHYDVSNDFYALWLDERMVYSCGYFTSPDVELDQAQLDKLDYLCRKLRLQPGERLLDIGCGWGGLIRHAAQHYGVDATGITLSQKQAELAERRIQEAGLAGRCRVSLSDYRTFGEDETYDKIVSVGMFEHVGAALLPTYFSRAWRLLKPGGAFLNHGIAATHASSPPPGPNFLTRYIFPDGELVPISAALQDAETVGFEVRDVESLREHYALTLGHWAERLESNYEVVRELVDEATYRIWQLMTYGSRYNFEQGKYNIYQTLLVKPEMGRSHLPLTRADWYI